MDGKLNILETIECHNDAFLMKSSMPAPRAWISGFVPVAKCCHQLSSPLLFSLGEQIGAHTLQLATIRHMPSYAPATLQFKHLS